jgi:SAM-dependent methyltransferase
MSMDLAAFRELLSQAGQTALADAAALAPTEAGFLATFEKLRKRHSAERARAALETVLLRIRAKAKHSLADQLYLDRESLEQSSSEAVSRHRARRFRDYRNVLDLCCGAGIDAVHLAQEGCRVTAIDRDPLRLAMAEANAAAYGVGDRVKVLCGDVLSMELPPAEAAFVDPSRRDGDRRFLDPDRYQPPLGSVIERFPAHFPIAAKIAPGVARRDLERFDAEAEFISSGGELKECVLWLGPLKTTRRRATVLPDHTLASSEMMVEPPPAPIGEFIYDPDAAAIRADLMPLLAQQLDAAPIDHGVAVLTGSRLVPTPFADAYRALHAAPFHAARLRDYLRGQNVGRVTVLKRAVAIDANEVLKKLKLAGGNHRHVIITRSLGRVVAIVVEACSAARHSQAADGPYITPVPSGD